MSATRSIISRAIEQELDRDMDKWMARWTYPGGSYLDAPEPPTDRYKTDETKLAGAVIAALAEAGLVIVPREARYIPSSAAGKALWQAMFEEKEDA